MAATTAMVSVHPGPRITQPRYSRLSAGSRGLLIYEAFSEWAEGEWSTAKKTTGHFLFLSSPDSCIDILTYSVNAWILSECTKAFAFGTNLYHHSNARTTHFLYLGKLHIERLFSLFGLILSKLRSRLALKNARSCRAQVTFVRRAHVEGKYQRLASQPRHIIPDPLLTQNKDTTSASSNEITPEITANTSNFDLDGDENSLAFIAEASWLAIRIGQC